MPDQDVRRQQISALELGAQLANYGGGVARSQRRIAAVVACAVVGYRARAARRDLWLDRFPHIERVAEPGLEDHGARTLAFELAFELALDDPDAMMQVVGGNGGSAGGDRDQQ